MLNKKIILLTSAILIQIASWGQNNLGLKYQTLPNKVRINFETMYPKTNAGAFKNKEFISSSWQKVNDSVYEVQIIKANKTIIFSRYYKSGIWQMGGQYLPVVAGKINGLPKDLQELIQTQYKTATFLRVAKISTPFNPEVYELYFIQKNIKITRYFLPNGFALDTIE